MNQSGGLHTLARLLVGVDLEGRAEGALAAASALARIFEAELIPLHVIPSSVMVGEDLMLRPLQAPNGASVQTIARSLEASYGAAWREARTLGPGPRITEGHVAEEMLRVAAEKQADLIVVGPHRRRGRFDFSNTVQALLAHSHLPLWIQPGDFRAFGRILVPIDLSDGSRALLESAARVAPLLGAEVEVVYYFDAHGAHPGDPDAPPLVTSVWSQERHLFEQVVASVPFGDVPVSAEFTEGRAVEEIVTRQDDFDLIIMGTHGRRGLLRFVLRNVAAAVLERTHTPVLVVPTVAR